MRLRSLGRVLYIVIGALAVGLWTLVRSNVDEILFVVGLLAIAWGFHESWRPGMYLVPGAVLVWISMPGRVPFITRAAARRGRDRVKE